MLKTIPTNLREATQEDTLELLFFCKRFYKKAGYTKTGAYNTEKVLAILERLIGDPSFFTRVVVEDGDIVGAVAFTTSESPFSNALIGTEVFFWLEENPKNGRIFVHLLAEYEEWCKSRGCTVMKFGLVPSDNYDRVEKFLKKMKFFKAETAYIKEI